MSTAYAHDLLSAAKDGDERAAETLIESNSGLIWSIARRYFGRGAEPEDLYQLGCLGFLKAVRSFEPEYGTQFSTYAVPKIAGEMRRFLRDDGAVKVSRSVKERALRIRMARETLEQRLGRAPLLSELSAETGIEAEEIAAAELASCEVASLQECFGEDGLTLEDTLSDPEGESGLMEKLMLREAVGKLPEREQETLLLRYWKGLTQADAARVLGVSQVQVSRLERKAVTRLREMLE